MHSAWIRRTPAPPHNPGQAVHTVHSTPSPVLQSEPAQAGPPPACLSTRSSAQFSSPAFPGLRTPACSSTQSPAQFSTPAFPRTPRPPARSSKPYSTSAFYADKDAFSSKQLPAYSTTPEFPPNNVSTTFPRKLPPPPANSSIGAFPFNLAPTAFPGDSSSPSNFFSTPTSSLAFAVGPQPAFPSTASSTPVFSSRQCRSESDRGFLVQSGELQVEDRGRQSLPVAEEFHHQPGAFSITSPTANEVT